MYIVRYSKQSDRGNHTTYLKIGFVMTIILDLSLTDYIFCNLCIR